MENKFYKDICNKVNYSTYKNIEDKLTLSALGLITTNNLLLLEHPTLSTSVDALVYSIVLSNMFLYLSHGDFYTKDVSKIKNMYNEFIKNYNELNKTFEFDNPIQIHTMLNYLLYKGYLSNKKQYSFSSIDTKEINPIMGSNILVGNGVCRHTSSLLKDILNNYGFESYILNVYEKESSVNIKIINEQKYTIEELYNWVKSNITDEKYYNDIIHYIDDIVIKNKKNIELSLNEIKSKNILKKLSGNHAIVYTSYNNNSYYLDTTQGRIYRPSEDNKKIIKDSSKSQSLRIHSSITTNLLKNNIKLIKEINKQYPSIQIEQENKLISDTLEICNNNIDIFEKFYNENKELYNDISNEVVKIKNHKFLGI